jgi:MFS family permease
LTNRLPSGNRAALRWLFAIQAISMGAMEMSAPFWPLYLRELGSLSGAALAWAGGLAYAGPMAMAIVSTPLWGRLADRTGHKPMLLRALIGLLITQLGMAMANDVVTVLLLRLAQGALGGFIAAAQAYGASLVSREKRGGLMASLQVATALGAMAGPLLGGLLYDAVGFRALNVAAGILCAACAVAAGLGLPASPPSQLRRDGEAASPAPFAYGALVGLLSAIVLVQAGKMMPQVFFGVFAEQVLRAPSWLTGLCYGATALGLCIAAPFWGRRFEALPRHQVLCQVEAISWICAAVVGLQAISTQLTVFIAARACWGVCLAALLPVFYGLLSREADAAHQGRVLGAGNSAAKAGALLGVGGGTLALALLPVKYLFWPVVLVYVVAAVGLRILRRSFKGAAAGATNVVV